MYSSSSKYKAFAWTERKMQAAAMAKKLNMICLLKHNEQKVII